MSFVFEEGEPVDTGPDGEHSFEKVEGDGLTDNGASTLVFVEGTGIGGGTVIDDFERGDLSPYTNYDTGFSIQTSQVYEGSYSAGATSAGGGMESMPGNGLNYYPVRGDVIEYFAWLGPGTTAIEFGFGVQNTTGGNKSNENWYETAMRQPTEDDGTNATESIHIGKRKNGSWDTRTGGEIRTRGTLPTGEWLRGVIEWGSTRITFTVYQSDGSGGWTSLGSVYIDDSEWDTGGVEWHKSQGNPSNWSEAYADLARKIGTV